MDRLRIERFLDGRRVATAQPQRREQAERDRLAVRQVEVGGRLERVRERVAEVQPLPRAVGRVDRAGRAPPCTRPRLERRASRPASSSVLMRSASPCRRSRSGSVSSSDSSITTRAGQWNAPTRFLPCGVSIAVLPPMPASTWPTSVVGTATHGTPAQVGRRSEARRVGRGAAAERDDRAAAVEPQLRPELLDDRELLRRLAGRQLVRRGEPVTERRLCCVAVDAEHRRVGDERDRPVAGNELAEARERAELVVHAGRSQDDAVDVAARNDRVGDLAVERLPLGVQARELLFVLSERALAPHARSTPCARRRRAAR